MPDLPLEAHDDDERTYPAATAGWYDCLMLTTSTRLTEVLLLGTLITAPVACVAEEKPPGKDKPVAGSRSLGDPLLPQLGNGGYDARHYLIELDYDPTANHFDEATTTVQARATKTLSQFSLDFQDDLEVTGVTVGGRTAQYAFEDATPQLSDNPTVTQPQKLVVTPQSSTRPRAGHEFTVEVRYRGTPVQFTDPDESSEGWIRACYPLSAPQTCDGSFVVNEPMGAQSWFPSNNYPTDKATFETRITVPSSKTALGIGELASRKTNRDGTTTWRWTEDDPTATYLTTATVGDFDLPVGAMTETSTRRNLPVYNAIDSSATPTQKAAIQASLDRAPEQVNFLSNLFGRYPFDSTGAVADRAAGVGYALEVQTKPHYSGGFTNGNPSINLGTQLHELAHQWVGNSATAAGLERHLVQRGLGELGRVVVAVPRERRRRPGSRVRRPLREHPGRGLGDSRPPSWPATPPTSSSSSRPTSGAR